MVKDQKGANYHIITSNYYVRETFCKVILTGHVLMKNHVRYFITLSLCYYRKKKLPLLFYYNNGTKFYIFLLNV